jgi:hypothetical protein
MATQLTWTDKQREIFNLLEEGKEFRAITDLGYTRNMVSRVKAAREDGQKPEPLKEDPDSSRTKQSSGPLDLVAVGSGKSSPIVFRLDKKEIVLDPLELMKQYRYYTEIVKKDGFTESFSEVLTIAVKLLWTSLLDIPITEDLLNAIFYE